MAIRISRSKKSVEGDIRLAGSKSISNRVLIIRALCDSDFDISGLASSHDTQLMQSLLADADADVYDAGPAGTTFRFLTAYLALKEGTQVLTGSERMKKRPIKVLVEALTKLGAHIEYIGEEGYPPLKIHSPKAIGNVKKITLPADISSQYISALLMIAPTLPDGLEIELDGEIVSIPYILMTLNIMAYFGIEFKWEDNLISIAAQKYIPRPFTIEADWSAASYYYSIAALADQADIRLRGLFKESTQGDSAIAEIMKKLGVSTIYEKDAIRLQKTPESPKVLEYDFIKCPDLAQTVIACCGGLGLHGVFTGLQTLRIKETDRIAALQKELKKGKVSFVQLPAKFSSRSGKEYHMIDNSFEGDEISIKTYEDHRMAMAFAPLSLKVPLVIEEEMVVNKSYPEFWEDLKKLGFKIEVVNENLSHPVEGS
ncbi:MAG: 3-phosphoshikimate 1-carboxyvinyltransferase [Bacteroidia bacterium]|nr:3-phosphoshikimate 1-carboxyvinyltransferase [Bacteroidia bacterium]